MNYSSSFSSSVLSRERSNQTTRGGHERVDAWTWINSFAYHQPECVCQDAVKFGGSFMVSTVPELSTIAMLALGVPGLFTMRRQKRLSDAG